MSWKEILKSPVFVGEDFEQPENKEGDNFEWLNKFNVNDTNVKFISEDGSVRATLLLDTHLAHWKLYLFVVNEPLRGQGLGEKGLVELITELRKHEQGILTEILSIYSKYAGGNALDRKQKNIMDMKPPLDIILHDVDPDAKIFWQRMVNRYSHLGLKK